MDMVNHNNNKSIIDICPKLTSYNIGGRKEQFQTQEYTMGGAPVAHRVERVP